MRSALILAVLLAASSSQAAMLSASRLASVLPSELPGPWTSTFQLNQGIREERTTIAEFTFSTDTTNPVFVITEENVGDFGETWANVELWADGLNNNPHWTHRVVNWTHQGVLNSTTGQDVHGQMFAELEGHIDNGYLEDFVMDSITLEFFFIDRQPPQEDRAQLRWTIAGEATILPEPSLFVTVVGIGILSPNRRRRCSGRCRT